MKKFLFEFFKYAAPLAVLVVFSIQSQDWIEKVDTLEMVNAELITTDALGYDDMIAIWGDELTVAAGAKDTTIWYISEIGEKCDTTYKKIYAPALDWDADVKEYYAGKRLYKPFFERTIKCKTDTTYAKKASVRLRPAELEKLMEMIND